MEQNRRKSVEQTLRIKDYAIASSISAIAFADLQGNLTYVNRSFLTIWGYDTEEEALGKPSVSFWQMEEKAVEIIQALQQHDNWIGELAARKKDGTLFDVQLVASMVVDKHNLPICMMASFIDITERKHAEKALQESEEVSHVLTRSLTQGAGHYKMEYRFKHKNGQYHWWSDLFTMIVDAQGKPIFRIGSVRD